MTEVETPKDMAAYVGKLLGVSDWVTVDQDMIDQFAHVTGDNNWSHVDVERAKRELPDGKTIAHGMLTMSLMTGLGLRTYNIRQRGKSINYGSNKVRFMSPVPSGTRIRLHRTLEKCEPADGAVRLTFSNIVEIEGGKRPAMVAESISLVYEKGAA
jgi:acyl dehydratase